MTLPAYKDIGTDDPTTPTWPTHVSGDFALLFVEHANNSTSITTPSGWTAIPGCPIDPGSTVNSCLSAFYRRATSSSETNPTVNFAAGGTQNHKNAVILTFTGVSSSTPIHAQTSGFSTPTATALTLPGLTTLLDDCLIIHALTWDINNAGPLGSAEANAGLGSVTERFDKGVTTGNGGGMVIFDGTLASHTTIAPSTVTMSSTCLSAMLVLALCPADKTLPTLSRKTLIVNTGPGM